MRRTSLFTIAPLFFIAACSTGESTQDTPTPEAGSTVTQESSAANESDQTTPKSSSKAKDSKRSTAGDADSSTENTAASAGGSQEPVADSNQGAGAGAGASNRAVDYVASDYLDLVMHNPAPGQTATVAGTYYEVCVLGDGFGLHTVLAGENTSCGFGSAVLDAQTAGHNPTGENIRDFYQPEISVTSPTTGQTYNMQCSVLGDKSMECTGGNNARVVLY
ncbi:hypothetical protein [Corynebacterium sp. HMSC04H06]|uniref:hypothetical protein n=1 Tax=Corynebacterium sp. HMSC04H06 TaxID=1581050 RepID=UPI0008A602EF|nr:hypothetical protein [Corynebacterium sp. HMSC04H06]OFS20555.1 hypothetical protein HMPREF3067_07125 [Corynebacterium sp. HMSC04H06]